MVGRKYKRARARRPAYKLLTTAEAQELLAEQKEINHTFGWRAIPDRSGRRWRLEASVWVPSYGLEINLWGNIGRTNHSFALIYRGYCLRVYNVHFSHHNPNCNDICEPHKQDWDENYANSWAYVVHDISTDNINSALMDFLKECNIEVRGAYQPILL